jgi:hypothetical protein
MLAPSLASILITATADVIHESANGSGLGTVGIGRVTWNGSLACRADPSVRTLLRLAGGLPTRGKISLYSHCARRSGAACKDERSPQFSQGLHCAALRSIPEKIGSPTPRFAARAGGPRP